MADQSERETYDISITVRVTPSLHERVLHVIGARSTVSDYVRRLMEAAVAEPNSRIVLQTVDELSDTV